MKTLIKNATIVNEGKSFVGCILLHDDLIAGIFHAEQQIPGDADYVIDATGQILLPGIIDEHVHFREPGMTDKADIESESRAAAAGGVTSYFEMPNTNPPTVTLNNWQEKMELAAQKSVVNYSFFFGATNQNIPLLKELDTRHTCGVKLFMGSSTGNMLVDREESLREIFRHSPLPIMAHCEETSIINQNAELFKALYGPDPDILYHPQIRSKEACIVSTQKAIKLAKETDARLHIAHVTTANELELINQAPANITAEVCLAHLLFTDDDYATLGTSIKCNPAVKTAADRAALRRGLTDGSIFTVATDHAPHRREDKQGGCLKAASGMPMIQFSLPAMLTLADEGCLTITKVAELMTHQPARLFNVEKRGFIREGYKADLVLLKHQPFHITQDIIQSKCGWSPLEGRTLNWTVNRTICNGHTVYENGKVIQNLGEAITFHHD